VLSTEIEQEPPRHLGRRGGEGGEAVAQLSELEAAGVEPPSRPHRSRSRAPHPRIQRVAARPGCRSSWPPASTPTTRAHVLPLPGPGVVHRGSDPMTEMSNATSRRASPTPACGPPSSSAPPTPRGDREAWSGCCGPWPRPPGDRVPISTHTTPGPPGPRAAEIFARRAWTLPGGDRPLGDTTELSYLEELVANAPTWAWTASGWSRSSPSRSVCGWWRRCASGVTPIGWCSHTTPPAHGRLDEGVIRATMPRWNFRHITSDVLPALRELGVTRLRSVRCVDNPRPSSSAGCLLTGRRAGR